jgi:hypothetical protein
VEGGKDKEGKVGEAEDDEEKGADEKQKREKTKTTSL